MRNSYAMAVLVCAGLAGCASHEPAPVVERAPTAAPAPVIKPAVPVPISGEAKGLYTVKKGDTLLSISLEHGLDYKEVAAMNGIDNPNRIQVGQQLRFTPAEGETSAVVVKPIVSMAPQEAKPASANTESFKREPKGGKVAYSEQALARMRESGQPPPAVDKPVEKTPEKIPEKPAAAPPPTGDDAVDWGWPVPGKVLANFVDGGVAKESSKGIDLAGKLGEPVQATAAGKVVYVGSGLRGYGNLVIVRHNASYLSAYAHNSKILVKEGQAVAKGQAIAEIGSSDADQAKLHFEIRRQGKPVDPMKYLPAR